MKQRLANAVREWWASPKFIGAAVALGGLAVGTGVARAMSKPACPVGLGLDGGVLYGVRYLERMRGGAAPDEEVPMVVLMHTLTGRPEGYAGGMNGIGRARLILPEGEYTVGSGRSWFPRGIKATVNAGNKPEEMAAWRAAGERMARFIETIAHCRPTVGKPVVTGSSQGGEMAILLANGHRKLVSGAVTANSDLPSPLWTDKMAPIAMLNGTGDTTVPYEWARAHAQQAAARGQPVTFESFPSSGHDLTSAQTKAWIGAVRAMVGQVS